MSQLGKINAYVMAADPAFLEESVLSYYGLVDKIIVTYDRQKIGWLGVPIPIDQCLNKLKSIDTDRKMHFIPGDFYQPGLGGVASDTHQRQISLDAASEGADWVLMFDTDEVLADQQTFISCLKQTAEQEKEALVLPMRWIFCHVKDNLYLEQCTRFWQVMAGFPGPVAIRPGQALHCCRQSTARQLRVDFKSHNTDPAQPHAVEIDRVIAPDQGIYHFSLVRDEEYMLRKAEWSTHAKDYKWEPIVRHWQWARRHPFAAALGTPFRRSRNYGHLRMTQIDIPVVSPNKKTAATSNR